jgi:hypothetical protein
MLMLTNFDENQQMMVMMMMLLSLLFHQGLIHLLEIHQDDDYD